MKKLIRTILPVMAAFTLGVAPLSGQPNAPLPSDEAWKEIASNSALPSEHSNPFGGDLRADRPTGEAPIGGMSAPAPSISLLSLIAFALAAAGVVRRKRDEAE